MIGPNLGALKEEVEKDVHVERKQTPDGEIKIGRVNTRSAKAQQPITSLGTHGAQDLLQLQNEDETLHEVIKWVEQNKRSEYKEVVTQSPELRHFWHIWPLLKIKEGILYKSFHTKDGISEYIQFMVPRSMRPEVLQITHNSLGGGVI